MARSRCISQSRRVPNQDRRHIRTSCFVSLHLKAPIQRAKRHMMQHMSSQRLAICTHVLPPPKADFDGHQREAVKRKPSREPSRVPTSHRPNKRCFTQNGQHEAGLTALGAFSRNTQSDTCWAIPSNAPASSHHPADSSVFWQVQTADDYDDIIAASYVTPGPIR